MAPVPVLDMTAVPEPLLVVASATLPIALEKLKLPEPVSASVWEPPPPRPNTTSEETLTPLEELLVQVWVWPLVPPRVMLKTLAPFPSVKAPAPEASESPLILSARALVPESMLTGFVCSAASKIPRPEFPALPAKALVL